MSSHPASVHHPQPCTGWSSPRREGGVSRGSRDPGGAGGGFPRLNLPRLSSPPSPTPMAERVSSGPSAHSHRLGRPWALRSEGIHSPPAPAGLLAEHRLRSRRLRGLRTRVSARAGRCARRPAGLVRGVCLWRGRCVCEPPPGARRPRRPPRASAPPGPAPGRGLERSVRQGPRPRAVRRPRRPRPRPPQASPQRDPSRPLSRLDAAADTRTLTDTRPLGRGRAGLRRCQPRPRRRPSPDHALAPGPADPAGTRSHRRPPAHSTAGGKLTAGRAALGARRPPAPARRHLQPLDFPLPSSGPTAPTPHPQQPAPRSLVLWSTPGNWRSVAAVFPFYRQDN